MSTKSTCLPIGVDKAPTESAEFFGDRIVKDVELDVYTRYEELFIVYNAKDDTVEPSACIRSTFSPGTGKLMLKDS